jgi:hypothetical protein
MGMAWQKIWPAMLLIRFPLFFSFLAVLGFELRTLHFLGSHSITWATPAALHTGSFLIPSVTRPSSLLLHWAERDSHILIQWIPKTIFRFDGSLELKELRKSVIVMAMFYYSKMKGDIKIRKGKRH